MNPSGPVVDAFDDEIDHGGGGPITVDGGVTIDVDTEAVRRLGREIGAAYDALRDADLAVAGALLRAQPQLVLSAVGSPLTAARLPGQLAELSGPGLALGHAAANLALECGRVAAAYDQVEGRATALLRNDLGYGVVTGALSLTYSPRTARIESVGALGPRPAPRELADLAAWMQPGPGEPEAHPGRIDVVERTTPGPDGRPRSAYIVVLPGTTSLHLPGFKDYDNQPRDMGANLRLASNQSTAELAILPEALDRAGVPAGAQLTFVGHSQGGMTAMAAAADPRIRSRYAVRHVITFGSPIARMPAAGGVRVLSVEHRSDPVPSLDLEPNQATPRHVTVQVGRDTPGPDGTEHHEMAGYVVAARSIASSEHPSLTAFDDDLRASGVLAPRGLAERDRVSVRRVELTLNPPPLHFGHWSGTGLRVGALVLSAR